MEQTSVLFGLYFAHFSKPALFAVPWTEPHTARHKKNQALSSFPLSVHGLASLDPELAHCLSALCDRALSPFSVSVQDQSGCARFLPSVQHRPRSHPLDQLHAQSSLCSLTLTIPWESYRSLEPAIKSVNGSNTQGHK